MKKILVLASAMFLALAAQSAVTWDWWFGNAFPSNRGCAFGLICFNDGGFLPVSVLFNFDKSMFGAEE